MIRKLPRYTASRPPKVTVVIPCYKYGRYLDAVVNSAIGQDGVDVEIIIVDDASPDGSADIARSLRDKHEQVSLIAHSENRGHIATYNDGLAAATGKYVVLLSADDLLTKGSLKRSTALLEAEPNVAFVYGYAPDLTDRPYKPRVGLVSWTIWTGDEWIEKICRRGSNVIMNPEVVMRHDVLRELGGYDAKFPHAADLYLWLRAATKGSVGRINGCDQALYRVHGDNMHMTAYAGILTDITERRKTFEKFIHVECKDHPRKEEYQQLQRKALAVEATRWAIRAYDLSEDDWQNSVHTYRELATSTWAGIRGTQVWSGLQRRMNEKARPSDRFVFHTDWEIRHKLRWRRWRRFGT